MKNSQKGFVAALLIGIIALLVIVGGVYMYSKQANTTPKYVKNESAILRYPVLENENLWLTRYVTTDIPVSWNIPSKNIVLKKNQENDFSCGNNKAEFVNYTSYSSGNVGGWNNISVIDCGIYYFVYENGDAGPKMYGPFEQQKSVPQTAQPKASSTSTTNKPTIAVLSPNGGETWKMGQTYIISYSLNGNYGPVMIKLNRYADDGIFLDSRLVTETENRSVSYTVPTDLADTRGVANRYKIEIYPGTARELVKRSDYLSIIR